MVTWAPDRQISASSVMEQPKSAWDMTWMGNKWFGHDVDMIFAYQTPKIVKIHDRALGVVKNLLLVAIVVYIFVYNIWYKGMHFVQSPVEGISRQQWQEPTDNCNPYHIQCGANYKTANALPYCSQYTGKEPAAKVVKSCEYYDARELPVDVENGVLLPTYIATYKQTRACAPMASSCSGKWKYVYPGRKGALQTGTGQADDHHQEFVADAEDFTLLLAHSFRTSNGLEKDTSNQMQGYWKPCKDCKPKPIKCVSGGCQKLDKSMRKQSFTKGDKVGFLSSAHNRSKAARKLAGISAGRLALDEDLDPDLQEDQESDPGSVARAMSFAAVSKLQQSAEPDLISIEDGDVVSLKTLLSMAGKSLDSSWAPEEGHLPFFSPRYRGIALVVTIKYENLERWTLFDPNDPPWYTISVQAMPADSYKHTTVHEAEDGKTRIFTLKYGTMIIVKQTGTLAFFSLPFALIALTSAMALLAVSNVVTEILMLYVLPRKADYQQLKYKESHDFHPDEKLDKPESGRSEQSTAFWTKSQGGRPFPEDSQDLQGDSTFSSPDKSTAFWSKSRGAFPESQDSLDSQYVLPDESPHGAGYKEFMIATSTDLSATAGPAKT